MRFSLSAKTLKIDKASSVMFAAVAIASIVATFSLISTKALLAQAGHQKRVLNAQKEAVKQLQSNISAANTLTTQFEVFNSGSTNVIGGANNNSAGGPKDGENARIVLDALPSQYDFPALLSSVDKILNTTSINNRSISGSDESVTADNSPAEKPQPTIMAFSVGGSATYGNMQNLIKDFERSIRPFDITTFQFNGTEDNMRFGLTINTYFQAPKSLTIKAKEVK